MASQPRLRRSARLKERGTSRDFEVASIYFTEPKREGTPARWKVRRSAREGGRERET